MSADDSLKVKTARTLKWNVIDRVASQILYAITGIILAKLLSVADFGLVGAVLVFQAFASLLVDSGFSYALIQKKEPTSRDYSTVLWFNLGISIIIYAILYVCAPLIADFFQGDKRLIPLSRVMFLSFIFNGLAIVQTNMLMKKMDVKMVAVSNSIGLILAGAVGIVLAVLGFGAWAIVWQTITLSVVKTLVLWTTQKWRPSFDFSWKILRGFFGIGSRMMITSFLNTLFLNIYAMVIGNRVVMTSLGYYNQSDKWSKMGIMSISQTLTSSFLPTLSAVQDDADRFKRVCSKMNRFTAYLLFPAMIGLMALATPIFHLLFGEKWDPSIILFQLLLLRGLFTVLIGLYNNFLLSQGHAKMIMWMEILRDSVAVVALAITFPYMNLSTAEHPVYGLEILLWGQVISTVITYIATLVVTSAKLNIPSFSFIKDLMPYLLLTLAIVPFILWIGSLFGNSWVAILCQLIFQALVAVGIYAGVLHLAKSKIQKDALSYLRGKL